MKSTPTGASRRGFAVPPRFSGLLVIRRHVDLLRVNSALCSPAQSR